MDNINHPSHYYKYRFRAGRKGNNTADDDIKKAEWYEDYLIKMRKERE